MSINVVTMLMDEVFATYRDGINSIAPTESSEARGVITIPIVFFGCIESSVEVISQEAKHLATPLDLWKR